MNRGDGIKVSLSSEILLDGPGPAVHESSVWAGLFVWGGTGPLRVGPSLTCLPGRGQKGHQEQEQDHH